jgi:histidinol-phosphate aminotransferase
MTNFANKNIQAMKPYSPPLEDRRVFSGQLLDFNERTIPVGKKVALALIDLINNDQLQLYPEYGDLCNKIANYSHVKENQVMITNGSDQGIELIFNVYTEKGDKVIIPSPSFAMFYQCAKINENQLITPYYEDNLSFPTEKVLSLINKGVRLIAIGNPNNPIGTVVCLEDIRRMLKKALENRVMVYIDEAYFEFSKITAAEFIDEYPNLVITRTFSKALGLAALRIGYILSSNNNINEMMKVRGPYDINMPAAVAAKATLDDLDSINKYVEEVMNEAKPMVEKFLTDNGIKYFDSKANFILFRPRDSTILVNKLLKSGFLTRPREGEGIEGTIRVTIGTVEQMKNFIEKMNNV